MAIVDERERLADFLEQQLFGPVLDESPDHHPPFRRAEVEEIRATVAREREQVRSSPSANRLVLSFREAGQRSASTGLETRLRGLGLPTFGAVGDELEKLAAELGIAGRPEPSSFPD